jgi:hypothetical protein
VDRCGSVVGADISHRYDVCRFYFAWICPGSSYSALMPASLIILPYFCCGARVRSWPISVAKGDDGGGRSLG